MENIKIKNYYNKMTESSKAILINILADNLIYMSDFETINKENIKNISAILLLLIDYKAKVLKKIFREYFQERIKASDVYKEKFGEAVDFLKEYLETISKEDKEKVEKIVDKFLESEAQTMEDVFVTAVKYAYKVFKEVEEE